MTLTKLFANSAPNTDKMKKARIDEELTRRAAAILVIDKIDDPTMREAKVREERIRRHLWEAGQTP